MSGITQTSSKVPLNPVTQDSLLLKLPDEIKINILAYLDIRSLNTAGLTCGHLRQLHHDATLWKRLCIQAGFPLTSVHVEMPEDCSWKIYYKQFQPYLQKPFPGRRAVFEQRPLNNWSRTNYYGGSVSLMKELRFTSETKGVFLKGFGLLGYKGGGLSLVWELATTNPSTFKDYFASLDLITKQDRFFYMSNSLVFENSEDVIKLFLILAKYNEIPKEERDLVERLVFSKNWELVTPLTKEDLIRFEDDKKKYHQRQ